VCLKKLPFVDEMAIDLTIMVFVTSNLDYLCHFQMMFDLAFLLPMLIAMHSFIEVAQFCDVFV